MLPRTQWSSALPLAAPSSGLLFQHGISEIILAGGELGPGPCCWVELSLPLQYWTRLPGMLGKCSWHAPKPSELTLGAVLPGTEHQALKPHPPTPVMPSAVAWKALRIFS